MVTSRGRPKTVLMVDYYFPPLAGAGAQRTLGYIPHLARYGWEPIVLTVRSGDSNFHDASLLDRIPQSVDVQRTPSFEPFKVARWLARPFTVGSRGNGFHQPMGLLEWTTRQMRSLEYWIFFPDRNVGWVPFAVARALRINQDRPLDLIYSTSTSISSHVVAHIVRTILRKPWVADFQDAWAGHPEHAARLFPSPVHASMARGLERIILRSADHVIVTADPLRQTFEQQGRDYHPSDYFPPGTLSRAVRNVEVS